MHPLDQISVMRIDGTPLPLAQLQGKVLLVVNTASACGFTPQFEALQTLHEEYGPQGLAVLGFPCNQFGAQDPGSNEEIADFCQVNYGVSFPMMAKVDVNGPQAHPLFQWLCTQAPGLLGSTGIKWNFTKFLVSRDRETVSRHAPQVAPDSLRDAIESALAEP
ncbi:MAG: glutathione peroxidase [Burkholderiaceae bacterium]|jgi:glutathione peroxidase|nr:glutathione peroxidase [Burkholderiaceae bacterium]